MNVSERCQIGLDFFEFLKESNRTSTVNRKRLKNIYDEEFRNGDGGVKDPTFRKVLSALIVTNKVKIFAGKVIFNPKIKALYQDQWYSPRGHGASRTQDQRPNEGSAGASLTPAAAPSGVQTRRALASLLMVKLKSDRSQFISDKRGVSITSDHEIKDGKICVCAVDVEEYIMHLYVENTGSKPVYFTYYSALHWLKYFTLKDEHKVTPAKPLSLAPGAVYTIELVFHSSMVGFYPATLAFEFRPDLQPSSSAFHIVRFVEAKCVTSLGVELAPKAPYKPYLVMAARSATPYMVEDGQRPEGLSINRLKPEVILNDYKVPPFMRQLINTLKYQSSYQDKSKDLLESSLSSENYSKKFQLLLHLEELQMQVDIKSYDIPNKDGEYAPMFRDPKNRNLLVVEVKGVSENRPSVLRGDQLLCWPEGETKVKYRGYVHSVELDKVKLGFSSKLLAHFVDGMKFNVEFTVNRLTMRIQHRAAELMSQHGLGKVLFPNGSTPPQQKPDILPLLRLFNRQLEENSEQYTAVQHIVAGSSKPAPYLVFGPPGTGKTVTVVEAIKQIEKTQENCHILACAPSNSAADLLCKKILEHVDPCKVFRMYATSVEPKRVPEELKRCSNLIGETYSYPEKKELLTYKVMVTTLLSAGRLVTGGIPPGHFTHIFVDEAGHAVETECLTPLAGLLDVRFGQLVLAGDPKQLGPILRSPLAIKYGMGVSLLERLMENFPLYQKDKGTFDNRFVTKLLKNYRSHPAILKIPNELFYEGELQVYADEMISNSYCRWDYLPKMDFPVIFHGVVGLDDREETSPSFFNVAEVEVLMSYVKKLFESRGKKGLSTLSPKDIGIITPYRKQVQKIRSALEKVKKDLKVNDMKPLKVGSVEEFQGQERKVILVSAVRSSTRYIEMDQKFTLGFLKNEKRFNVAVTRAKALLIVVGNPRVLKTDPTWARFIQYCCDEGGYTGFSHTEDEEEVIARMAALFINIEPQVETEVSVVQQQLEVEWRSDL